MYKTKVLLADHHAIFREGLQLLLEREEDFEVIKSVAEAEDIGTVPNKDLPDMFIIDIDLPTTDGIDFTRDIREHYPGSKIVILSHNVCNRCVRAALDARVNGYLLKTINLENLVGALRMIRDGELVFDYDFTYGGRISTVDPDKLRTILNDREFATLELAAIGLGNKAIAHRLNISDKTVSTHLFNIYRKFNVESRTAAVLYALKIGIINLEDLDMKYQSG